MTKQYRRTDTRKAPGLYIQWVMVLEPDDCAGRPDELQDGFWPSRNPEDAGWTGNIPQAEHEEEERRAAERMAAWQRGDWHYIGVIAEARCLLVHGGGSGTFYTLRSPGLWGIESDAGDYIREVFEDQKAELLSDLRALGGEPAEQEDVAA